MEGKMIFEPLEKLADGKVLLKVNKVIYTHESILAAAYKFTDNCYIHVDSLDLNHYSVFFEARDPNVDLTFQVNNFCNELIDQQLRHDLRESTKEIKELIVKKAFFPFQGNEQQ